MALTAPPSRFPSQIDQGLSSTKLQVLLLATQKATSDIPRAGLAPPSFTSHSSASSTTSSTDHSSYPPQTASSYPGPHIFLYQPQPTDHSPASSTKVQLLALAPITSFTNQNFLHRPQISFLQKQHLLALASRHSIGNTPDKNGRNMLNNSEHTLHDIKIN